MLRQLTFIATVAASLTALGTATGQAQQAAVEDIFAPVVGQQQPVPDTVQKPLKAASQRKTTVAVQKVAKTIDPAALAGGNESDQRIGQLEAQIADMQVVVGTMESMTRGRGAAAPSANLGAAAGAGGDLDIRVGRLENQMQSLGGQLTDLSNQIRLMNAKLGGGAAILRAPTAPAANGQQGALTPQVPAKQTALTAALSEQPANADTGFGQTTVIPDGQDQSLGQDGAPAIQAATPDAQQPDTQVAGLGEQPVAPPAGPQDAYDLAYGRVLQQDYAGAELAFRDYLTRFPQTPLASNAQYWLGQSFYARGQYKPAADAFLKGYKAYRTGTKAPDSLLKVAMSLSRLGQKETACSAFIALDTEFPNASAQIKHLAQSERDRTGC